MSKKQEFVTTIMLLMICMSMLTGCDAAGSLLSSTPDTPGRDDPNLLIIGCAPEPKSLNPYLISGDSEATKAVLASVLWGLVMVTPDLKFKPRLVTQVPTIENGLVTEEPFTVTYVLRDDALWSDGIPITAEDIRFTWNTIMRQDLPIASRQGYDKVERIDIVDEKTARLVFTEPYARYKELFSQNNPLLPSHVLNRQDMRTAIESLLPFASGPYAFRSWDKGKRIVLVRNNRFWGKKAQIASVVFQFSKTQAGLVTGFINNRYDVIFLSSTANNLDRLKTLEGKTLRSDPGLRWEHIGINTAKPPFDDVNVRKAIFHAIDRAKLSRDATGINDVLQSVVVPQQSAFYKPAWTAYDFNQTKATGYLERAGYAKGNGGVYEKSGSPLTMALQYPAGDTVRERLAASIKDDLADIGVIANIEAITQDALFNSLLPEGKFDIAIWSWNHSPEPDISRFFVSSMVPPAGQNFYRYANARADSLLLSAQATIDDATRAERIRQAQLSLRDDAVVLPLYQRTGVIAYDNRVIGIKNNTTFETPLWNLGEWSFGKN